MVGHSGSKSTSLRPDLHISAPQSRWTRHERPAPRPCATTRALAGGAAVCEQGPPNPVGSRGSIGRRSRFCRLFRHREAASGQKLLLFDPNAHGRGAAGAALMHMKTHVARFGIAFRVLVATDHMMAPRGPRDMGRAVIQRGSHLPLWLRC